MLESDDRPRSPRFAAAVTVLVLAVTLLSGSVGQLAAQALCSLHRLSRRPRLGT